MPVAAQKTSDVDLFADEVLVDPYPAYARLRVDQDLVGEEVDIGGLLGCDGHEVTSGNRERRIPRCRRQPACRRGPSRGPQPR